VKRKGKEKEKKGKRMTGKGKGREGNKVGTPTFWMKVTPLHGAAYKFNVCIERPAADTASMATASPVTRIQSLLTTAQIDNIDNRITYQSTPLHTLHAPASTGLLLTLPVDWIEYRV